MTLTGSSARLLCTPARGSSEGQYSALIESRSLLESLGHSGNLIFDLASLHGRWEVEGTAGTPAVMKSAVGH